VATDVTELAEIQIRRIWILYFKSTGFKFATQSRLVQFSQVKHEKF